MPKRKDRERCGRRTQWTAADLSLLRATRALEGDYISKEDISSLAAILNVGMRVVEVWFQNQRQRREPLSTDDLVNAMFLFEGDAEGDAMCMRKLFLHSSTSNTTMS